MKLKKNAQPVKRNGIELLLCVGVLAPEAGMSALYYCKSIPIPMLFYCPVKPIEETLNWAVEKISQSNLSGTGA